MKGQGGGGRGWERKREGRVCERQGGLEGGEGEREMKRKKIHNRKTLH